jgi:hypothetical protein
VTRSGRIERAEGIAIDSILIAVAALESEDVVQEWLFAHPRALYHGLAIIHMVACPAVIVAVVMGFGLAGRREELQRRTPGVLGWALPLLLCGSFVIPAVLGLSFRLAMWEYMGAIFAPLVIVALWLTAIVVAERRGWIRPAHVGQRRAWWKVQGLALLCWAYLLWLETMLLVAAGMEGPLTQVGIPLGILIDYLPIRIVLYYVRDSSRWERYTIAASVVHLLYRIAAAG